MLVVIVFSASERLVRPSIRLFVFVLVLVFGLGFGFKFRFEFEFGCT